MESRCCSGPVLLGSPVGGRSSLYVHTAPLAFLRMHTPHTITESTRRLPRNEVISGVVTHLAERRRTSPSELGTHRTPRGSSVASAVSPAEPGPPHLALGEPQDGLTSPTDESRMSETIEIAFYIVCFVPSVVAGGRRTEARARRGYRAFGEESSSAVIQPDFSWPRINLPHGHMLTILLILESSIRFFLTIATLFMIDCLILLSIGDLVNSLCWGCRSLITFWARIGSHNPEAPKYGSDGRAGKLCLTCMYPVFPQTRPLDSYLLHS